MGFRRSNIIHQEENKAFRFQSTERNYQRYPLTFYIISDLKLTLFLFFCNYSMIIEIVLPVGDDKTQNRNGPDEDVAVLCPLIAPARGSSSAAARPIHNSPAAGWSSSNCCYPAPPRPAPGCGHHLSPVAAPHLMPPLPPPSILCPNPS